MGEMLNTKARRRQEDTKENGKKEVGCNAIASNSLVRP
jgi:hypothetical protein